MPYPTLSSLYGFKPVGLIGGQVFVGSTRNYPVAYNYSVPIFYGDFVNLTSGYVTNNSASTSANALGTATIGVFLGCYYTNPTTKQRQYAQYYPGSVLAGDITAIIGDDPDQVFRTAVATTTTANAIASASSIIVGQNMAGNTLVGSASTGNSLGAVVTGAATSAGNYRVLSLVPDTQISTSCTYVSGGAAAATSVTVSGLTVGQVIPSGTDIFNLVNGQLQFIGACTSGSQTVSSATSQSLTTTSIGTQAAGTLVLVQTPEVLVKVTFASHRYYVA